MSHCHKFVKCYKIQISFTKGKNQIEAIATRTQSILFHTHSLSSSLFSSFLVSKHWARRMEIQMFFSFLFSRFLCIRPLSLSLFLQSLFLVAYSYMHVLENCHNAHSCKHVSVWPAVPVQDCVCMTVCMCSCMWAWVLMHCMRSGPY